MGESLSARPEARFAHVAGIAGGLAAAAISVKGIFASASSTAAIGFVFVPLIAAAAAVPAGVWGLALGCVWLNLQGARRYYPAVLVMAWVVALAVPAAIGWEVWRGLVLERAVAEVKGMNAALLYNAATPRAILERLAKDADESLARNARTALERRAKAPGS